MVIVRNIGKEVKVYPYVCTIPNSNIKVADFSTIFKISKAEKNVIKYHSDTYLVLIIDQLDNGFMFGRFFKLREDSPTIFDRKKGKERDISLLAEENIKEESHFIWNIQNGIIFAEYNFNAVRMFDTPLSFYLNEKFGVEDCTIMAIPDKHTFEHLKKEPEILALNLRFAQESTKNLEKKNNMPAWNVLLDIGQDNESIFEVSVKRSRKKDSKLKKEKVISLVGDLAKSETPPESIRVETLDLVYDLIKNNLLFYKLPIQKNGRKLDKADFNYKAQELYKRHIDNIKENLKKE